MRMRRLQLIHGKEGEELDADALETVTPNNNVVNQPGVIQQPGVIVVDIPPEDYKEEGSTTSQQQQDDSTTNSVWENGTPTTLDNNGNNQQSSTQGQTTPQQISQEAYEASFPTQPETIFKNQPPRAATTFALFSSPTRFNPTTIHTTNTHYLNNALEGMIYLDVNGDGIRGSTIDRSINALEFDTGVGGIESTLVHCQSNEIVMGGYPLNSIVDVSRPNLGESVATEALQTDRSDAGLYNFDLSNVKPGRYYIMYKSPKDYRLNANILPLERDEGGSGECIPKGGEGNGYIQDVYNKGDLDWNGYCGRTIGCFEVGPKFDLKKDFANLQLNEEQDNQFEGTIDNLVALPSKNMLKIGVTKDPWPLNANQFADGKVTLSFPERYSPQDLEDAVPTDFESSSIKKSLEVTMATLFAKSNNKIGDFDVKGINFIGGEIFTKSRRKSMLRGRGLQRDNVGGAVGVTYTFTTRGKYSPPPYEQLGTLVSDSINADPVGLVKSLKDRENPDVQLPEVFDEVDDANVRHLTLKNNEQLLTAAGGMGLYSSLQVQAANEGSGLASWASIPVAILSAMIASLVGVLLFRRVFTRRQKQVSNDHPLTMYMKKGSVGFAASRRRSEDSDMKKKKSGRGKSKRGFAVARRGSDDDDKKKKRGYRDDEDDDEYHAAVAESSRSHQRENDHSSQRASRGRQRTEGSDNGRTISNSSRSSSAEDQSRYSAPVNGRRNNSNRHSSRRRGTID